jgi:hypothetical protein
MARLPFRLNLYGYAFEKGLADIRHAYDATIVALEEQRADVESAAQEFHRAVAAGETEAVKYDEDGEVLYYYHELHEMHIEDITSSIPIARNAYVVILHHYWEKCCVAWMQIKEYKAKQAYVELARHGLIVDREGLETLREACNTIKHNNRALYDRCPCLFVELPASSAGANVDFADLLRLQPHHIDRMFGAVKTSGIQIDSQFAPPIR